MVKHSYTTSFSLPLTSGSHVLSSHISGCHPKTSPPFSTRRFGPSPRCSPVPLGSTTHIPCPSFFHPLVTDHHGGYSLHSSYEQTTVTPIFLTLPPLPYLFASVSLTHSRHSRVPSVLWWSTTDPTSNVSTPKKRKSQVYKIV